MRELYEFLIPEDVLAKIRYEKENIICVRITDSVALFLQIGRNEKVPLQARLAFLRGGGAAQTVVPNGSYTTETESNGEVLEVASGTTVSVNGAPTIALSNDNSVLNNQGSLSTQGVTRHYPRTRQCFRRRQRGR